MTNDELNRMVCEKVLGWEWRMQSSGGWCWFSGEAAASFGGNDGLVWSYRQRGGISSGRVRRQDEYHTPDFCNDWRAFGVLWEALLQLEWNPQLTTGGGKSRVTMVKGGAVCEGSTVDPDPRRALVLAALKAYGGGVEP